MYFRPAVLSLFLLPTASFPALLVDGFTSGTLTNSLGGQWGTYADVSSSISLIPNQVPGYNPAPYCMEIQFNLNPTGYCGVYTPFNSSFSATDISAYKGLRFWVQGAGTRWQAGIATSATYAGGNHYAYSFPVAPFWNLIEVPFSLLTQSPGPAAAWDPQHALDVVFYPQQLGEGPNPTWLQIGRVELYSTGEEQYGFPFFRSPRPKANQVGYLPSDSKFFSVITQTSNVGDPFYVINSIGTTVYTGALAGPSYDDGPSSAETVVRGDFSTLSAPGTYTVAAGGQSSQVFQVASGVYDSLWKDALRCFFLIRCGTALNDAQTGMSHLACHQNDLHTDTVPGLDRDFLGGWHNAGDFGKWTHEESFAVGHMLWLAEMRPDLAGYIPPGDPGLLAEAKWGLQWLLKMLNPDGSVLHKVDSEPNFAPLNSNADNDPTTRAARYASSYSTIDGADFTAVMAQAARVFQSSDPSFAATCAAASDSAWAWTQAHPNLGQSDPYYSDSTVWQEYLWAECERFRMTRDTALATALSTDLSAHPMSYALWNDPQFLGHLTLAFDNGSGSNATLTATAQNRILSYANSLEVKEQSSGYATVVDPTAYYWGSISAVLGAGGIFCAANAISGQDRYRQDALRMMDHILGVNSLDHSHAALYGKRSNLMPYHWAYHSQGKVMPGWLSEGPNHYTSGADPNLTALINTGAPPSKCFLDDGTSWASNEGTTDIESAFILLCGYFHSLLGNTPTPTPPTTSTSTPTATASRTPTSTPTRTPTPNITATPTDTSGATVTFTSTPTLTPTATVTASFTDTFTGTLTPLDTATPTSTSSPTTISTSTSTASSTWSPTPTTTASWTPTSSATATMTQVNTASPTATATLTSPVGVPTATSTPLAQATPLVFPNPAVGNKVNILPPPYGGTSDVRAEVFTTAFRKVVDTTFSDVAGGQAVTLELLDQRQTSLANGLYAVRVTAGGKRSFAWLIVLR